MKTVVIHPTKCHNTSIASARIAKWIVEKTEGKLIDDIGDVYSGDIDTLFIVNGPFVFSNFRDQIIEMSQKSKNVIYVSNDYTIKPDKRIKIDEIWANHLSEGMKYINWNLLTYYPDIENKRLPLQHTKEGLFYFGACRNGREEYFKKYFENSPYPSIISSSRKAMIKYSLFLKGDIKFIEPFSQLIQCKYFQTTIYIADKKSNKAFHSLANRFYESVSLGLAILIDSDTVETFIKSGFLREEIEEFIVNSKEDVLGKLPIHNEIREKQRLIFRKDYIKELEDSFGNLIINFK